MDDRSTQLEQAVPLSGLLGYLNFSDGRPDPRWQRQLNEAFAWLDRAGAAAPWYELIDALEAGLERLHAAGGAAFRDIRPAQAALDLARRSLAAYRRHHADLLGHLSERDLFQPFFLVRLLEAVLAIRSAEGDGAGEAAVVHRLNDFIGYRPIAVLETRPQGEPYDHERIRPIPLFLKGAGVGWGKYHDVLVKAIAILERTAPDLYAEAHFEFELLDELAIDVRAFDHGHPANRRPNYVFGEWDPHHLDNQGRYRRYVLRQITIDALLARVSEPSEIDREELLTEGAAVLAGTILMASGISGWGPGAHDSSASLAALLPRVARLRDDYYARLLPTFPPDHLERLRREEAACRQPFGGARQHVNAWLARQRATQLQQRCLAVLFAQMGFPEPSREEASRIPAVSVRMLSEVIGRLAVADLETDRGNLTAAAARLPEVTDLLHRGIACGAFVDPWNILGFQGLFPLSPAREDSVRDPRVEELTHVVEQTLNLHARLMSEAAAAGQPDLVQSLGKDLKKLAEWWDRFAATTVSDVRRVHGIEAHESARNVAKALARWRQRGEAAADIAFWRGHFDGFRSPKAFGLVVDTLLRRGDFRAALALLMSWLGQVEQVPLEDGGHSFPSLTLRWMLALTGAATTSSVAPAPALSTAERRDLVRKFFDYLEANAEEYWEVPSLETEAEIIGTAPEEEENLFEAAYEDVTYQDTTDDREGAVSDGAPSEPFDLEEEGPHLEKRLRFLSTLARLWQIAARYLASTASEEKEDGSPLAAWQETARSMRDRLTVLLDTIHSFPVPEPSTEIDSVVEYDRRRVLKEHLLQTAINTTLDMTLAAAGLRGAVSLANSGGAVDAPEFAEDSEAPPWEPFALRLEQALFTGEAAGARQTLAHFLQNFREERLLFSPLAEGGAPRDILRVRVNQTVLRALLANLPRLGLVRETFELLRAARAMEQSRPPRGKGVTEFNHFFQSAFQSALESVVESAADWPAEQGGDAPLLDLLERLTAPFLALWVDHSRTLQLSILDTVSAEPDWRALREFVRRYGHDLFHARFMTLANLRGILHRGVGAYLDHLRENPDPLHPVKLLDDLDRVGRNEAVRRLEIVLQAVIENYEEYKDYNTTTTQSDYGENLHVLLDFLRLKASYDRHAWEFRPLVLAHEVLARLRRDEAAVRWQEQLSQLTRDLAQQHLEQLGKLEKTHAVRLSTARDRLQEAFLKPLVLDRLCAQIEPAMAEARRLGDRPAFARLREELRAYTATPTGVGLDVPFWLRRLEAEVQRVQARHTTVVVLAENFFRVPRRSLSYDEIRRQFQEWERPALPS